MIEEQKTYSFGLYNKGLELAFLESGLHGYETITVRGQKRDVFVECEPLKVGDVTYQKTYMLRVDYRRVENAHAARLPFAGFGAMLCNDYVLTVSEMVYQWCDKHGFIINDQINHWPNLQFVLTRVGNRVDDENILCDPEETSNEKLSIATQAAIASEQAAIGKR